MKDYKMSDLTKIGEAQSAEIKDGTLEIAFATKMKEIDVTEGRYFFRPVRVGDGCRLSVYEVDEDAENLFDTPRERE